MTNKYFDTAEFRSGDLLFVDGKYHAIGGIDFEGRLFHYKGDWHNIIMGNDDHIPKAEFETTKPPIGIEPEYIFLERRKKELKKAIERQLKSGRVVSNEWINEFNKL